MHREVDLVRQPKAGDRKGPPGHIPAALAPTDVDELFGRLMRISLTLSDVDSAFAARLFSLSGILNIRKLRSG